MQKIDLTKQVYGRNTYVRVIDTQFSELYNPVTASVNNATVTVEQFFDYYQQLFFNIPATGDVNSHEFLVKASSEFLGGGVPTDREQAYIDEINQLRQQLLESAANYLNLNETI